MKENEARALIADLTDSEKVALYELLSDLAQNPSRAARLAG